MGHVNSIMFMAVILSRKRSGIPGSTSRVRFRPLFLVKVQNWDAAALALH